MNNTGKLLYNEDLKRKKEFLNTVNYFIIGISAIFLILRLFQPSISPVITIMLICYIVFALIHLLLIRKNFIRFASNSFLLVLWLSFLIVAWNFNGIYDVGIVAFFLVFLISAYLFKVWVTIVVTTLSMLYIWLLYILSLKGIKQFIAVDPYILVRDYSIIFVSYISLVLLYQQNMIKSVARVAELLNQKELDRLTIINTELRYREIFDSIDDAIFIHDGESGAILDTNENACVLFGYPKEQLLTMKVSQLSSLEEHYTQELAMMKINETLHTGRSRFEWRSKKADGSIFWSEVLLTRSKTFGQNLLLATVRDISQSKTNEIELINALEQAENSNRAKLLFLQNMSHEIRTPLNAITGFASLLNEADVTPPEKQEFSKIIVSNSFQLLSIFEDILTASRIEAGREIFNEKPVILNRVIDNLFAIFFPKTKEKNISLTVKKHFTDDSLKIYTDETKLVQIITNLLNNALKFTTVGGIYFGYTLSGSMLTFFVEDTGIGIKEDQQKIIFDRFVQADSSIQMNYGGTGLGLSISKSFANLLGGTMWVQSEAGKGSVFCFTVPFKPVLDEDSAYQGSARETPIASTAVLIAEDEENNFFLIQNYLKANNFEIIRAKNGKEAIELTHKHPNIELLIMDIRMPEMDGIKALTEIRKFKPNIPAIAQTAFALSEERDELLQAGFNDYIAKPIKRKEFLNKINRIINSERK